MKVETYKANSKYARDKAISMATAPETEMKKTIDTGGSAIDVEGSQLDKDKEPDVKSQMLFGHALEQRQQELKDD